MSEPWSRREDEWETHAKPGETLNVRVTPADGASHTAEVTVRVATAERASVPPEPPPPPVTLIGSNAGTKMARSTDKGITFHNVDPKFGTSGFPAQWGFVHTLTGRIITVGGTGGTTRKSLVSVSDDRGETWEARTNPLNGYLREVDQDPLSGRIVAVSEDDYSSGGGMAYSDDDGDTWTRSDSTGTWGLDIRHENGLWMVGSYQKVLTSLDGIAWTAKPVPFASNSLYGLGYNAGRWVACGDGLGIVGWSDDDGDTWTKSTGQPTSSHTGWDDVEYLDGRWWMFGNTVHRSPNAEVWEAVSLTDSGVFMGPWTGAWTGYRLIVVDPDVDFYGYSEDDGQTWAATDYPWTTGAGGVSIIHIN